MASARSLVVTNIKGRERRSKGDGREEAAYTLYSHLQGDEVVRQLLRRTDV